MTCILKMRKTFVRDNDGHWYFIPYDDYKQFQSDIQSEEWEEFSDKWDQYRLDGGVEGIPVIEW